MRTSALKTVLSVTAFAFCVMPAAQAAVQEALPPQVDERKASMQILQPSMFSSPSERQEARKNLEDKIEIMLAVLDHLEGEETYKGEIRVAKEEDREGRRIATYENRVFALQKIFGEWKVVAVQAKAPKGGTVYRETYDYDEWGEFSTFEISAYSREGKIKASSRIEFEKGIKVRHYFRQFDEKGKRTRFLSETYYANGALKTSSDYQYTVGKRFFVKKDWTGKTIVSSVKPIRRA